MDMTLTFPGAPLASEPPPTTNYAIEGPRHRLLLHPFPRRVRARFAGEVLLDSTRGALLHESNILPRLYVPLQDVRADLLERTDHRTHCPFKGDASYWSVRVGDRVAENAVWTYEEPIDEASWLRGLVSVYPERMDAWLDEDEEVTGLRDPYHRVDARRSSRRIEVRSDGQVLARSERPVVVAGARGRRGGPRRPGPCRLPRQRRRQRRAGGVAHRRPDLRAAGRVRAPHDAREQGGPRRQRAHRRGPLHLVVRPAAAGLLPHPPRPPGARPGDAPGHPRRARVGGRGPRGDAPRRHRDQPGARALPAPGLPRDPAA